MEPLQDRLNGGQPANGPLDRFQRRARLIDRIMNWFIPLGGLGVLVSLFGIFLFILLNALPLFQKARVTPLQTLPTGIGDPLLLGIDERGQWPFLLGEDGTLTFLDLSGKNRFRAASVPLDPGRKIHSAHYEQRGQSLAIGLSDGSVLQGTLSFPPGPAPGATEGPVFMLKWEEPLAAPAAGVPVEDIDTYLGESRKALAAIQHSTPGRSLIHTVSHRKKRALFGETTYLPETEETLAIEGLNRPLEVLLGADAKTLVVRMADDTLQVFARDPDGWEPTQRLRPFTGSGNRIASMDFVQGRVSLSLTSSTGRHVVYSLTRLPESGRRQFALTKEFPSLDNGAIATATSIRNKAVLVATRDTLSLRYVTTEAVRWQRSLPVCFQALLMGSRYDRIYGVDATGQLHAFALEDPHPQAGMKAFFGKIWYEGQDRPRYLWQSSGGSDSFEPKLSLIPLLFGSFKGTLYALLFAIPVAIMGAIYTSQFLHPRAKQVIKPMIEIMASIPSVVLGFIAALWLAPLIEDQVPSVLLGMLLVPASTLLAGYGWRRLPSQLRVHLREGSEFMLIIPFMAAAVLLAWQLGPLLEIMAFRYTDPATGQTYADFRIWWENWNGSQFQQRNAMVVGFIMGFAVIPIIFSIAEDALSSVPRSLVSGSLALGASRWQTTARIVLPSAMAGILSAVMIGLGRAVGETMIVLMATGNTPILDFDIFSGMRTLSATIAVELPEAPQGGTLYRSLFLGSLVLFILTFAINTIAEVLRGRIRERFRFIAT